MSKLNSDGNVIGRLGAIAVLAAAGFGLHRINCADGMCPVMKTDSCCAFVARAKAEAPRAATAVPSAASDTIK